MKNIFLLLLLSSSVFSQTVTVKVKPVDETGTNANLIGVGYGLDKSGTTVSFDPTEVDYYLMNSLPVIDVKKYGALGNGIHNDRSEINNAIAASGGKSLIFPPGHYLSNSEIIDTLDDDIYISGNGDVTIDASNNSESGVSGILTLFNPYTTVTILHDINVADTMIYLSTAGLTTNKVIQVTTNVLFASGIGQYTGEFYELKSIKNDTTVVLKNPSYASYTKSTITAYAFTKRKLHISGIKFVGDPDESRLFFGVYIDRYTDVIFDNCEFSGFTQSAMSINNCVNVKIHNCNVDDVYAYGLGYGISLSTVQNAIINGNIIKNCRHGISVGGDNISRNVLISSNIVYGRMYPNTSPHGIECHPGAEFISVVGNMLYNCAITLRGNNNLIEANHVNTVRTGSGISLEVHGQSRSDKIIGNTIFRQGKSSALNYGIYIYFKKNNASIQSLDINGNSIKDVSSTPIYFNSDSSSNVKITNLNIDNNIIDGDTSQNAAIFSVINKINYDYVKITNNRININSKYGIYFYVKDSAYLLSFKGNLITSKATEYLYTDNGKFKDVDMSDNYIRSTAIGKELYLTSTRNIYLKNNTFVGLKNGGIKINSPTVNFYNNANIFQNCTGEISNAAEHTYSISYTLEQ